MTIEKKQVPYATVLGSVLKEVREEIGLSQKDAAVAMGISQSAIARMELGKSCALENLIKSARAYGLPVSKVFEVCESRVDILKKAGYEVSDGFPSDVDWIYGDSRLLFSAIQMVPVLGGVISGAIAIHALIKKRDEVEKLISAKDKKTD